VFEDKAWSAAFFRALLLSLPLGAMDIALRTLGGIERLRFVVPNIEAHVWSLIPSTVFVHIGVVFLVSGSCIMLQGRFHRWAGILALEALIMLIGFVHVSAYVYLIRAVAPIDWSVVSYALTRPDSASMVALGEVSALEWSIIGSFFLLTLGHPFILHQIRFADVKLSIPASTSITMGVLVSMLALPAVSLSIFTPYAPNVDASMLRDPLVNIYVSHSHESGREDTADSSGDEKNGKFFDPTLAIERKPDAPPPKNVVLILLESTRAESTTPYNPGLATMPFLASVAQESLQVDRAYTLIPATTKSLVAILCSIPASRAILPEAMNRELLARCLPQLLADQGYDTVFMQTANEKFDRRDRMVADMGFKTFVGPLRHRPPGYEEVNFLGLEDESLLPQSQEWISAHGKKPFLAAFLTLNPHHDIQILHRYPQVNFGPEPPNRYLNALHTDDFFLQKLFQQFKDAGLYDNTLFVITGDHGEGWGEHGRFAHINTPYEEGVRVPLLFFDPSQTLVKPGHLPGPTQHLDIVPTLLDLLGYKITKGTVYGESIFHLTPNRPIDMACFGDCIARIQENWKVIYHYNEHPMEFYDLSKDPHEQHNIVEEYTDQAERMRSAAVEAQRVQNRFYWFQNLRAEQAKREAKASPASP
jgi:lipoteichoic acid synthase